MIPITKKPYSAFAQIYDEIMSGVNYKKWVAYILALLERYNHCPKTILDLACGTGNMSFLLADKGYKVVGIDKSEEMLTIAKSKLGINEQSLEFLCCDMLDFSTREKFDLILCLYDSINYLLSEEELTKAFISIKKALQPGGLFIFDFNTCQRLQKIEKGTRLFEGKDYNCFWRNDFDNDQCIWQVELEIFLKMGETFHYHEEVHKEKGYTIKTMENLLNKSSFEVLDFFTAYTFQRATENGNLVYSVCRSL